MKISDEMINRLMNTLGYATKKELAKALKISASDLNNRQKSGSLKKLLIDHAIHNNVNVDWLLTGGGHVKNKDNAIAEPESEYKSAAARRVTDNIPLKISDIVQKTIYILESNTIHKYAIAQAIDACYQSVCADKRLREQEIKIMELEDKLKLLAG